MDFSALSEQVGECLLAHRLMLVTAESCTGGWAAQAITLTSGSSQWFERGFITYSNQAKYEMLGVSDNTLLSHGAVSEQVAEEMVLGAIKNSHAQAALAITGIAGPTGGTVDKPVGMVCFAWGIKGVKTIVSTQRFEGDRTAIRRQAVEYALQGIMELCQS